RGVHHLCETSRLRKRWIVEAVQRAGIFDERNVTAGGPSASDPCPAVLDDGPVVVGPLKDAHRRRHIRLLEQLYVAARRIERGIGGEEWERATHEDPLILLVAGPQRGPATMIEPEDGD